MTQDDSPFAALGQRDYSVLTLVVEQAVARGVEDGLLKYAHGPCPRDCDRAEAFDECSRELTGVLHGAPDSSTGGLVGRVRDLEARVKLLIWLATIEATALVGLIVTVIGAVLSNHLRI